MRTAGLCHESCPQQDGTYMYGDQTVAESVRILTGFSDGEVVGSKLDRGKPMVYTIDSCC